MLEEVTKNKIIIDNQKYIEDVKVHTHKKVEYIKDYVSNWLYKATNLKKDQRSNINFIDCMSNAGIYKDGKYCTSIEVLSLFIEFAKKYPNKTFNLMVNDINKNRIDVLKKVANETGYKELTNINVFYDYKDVNVYLNDLSLYKKFFDWNSFTILFVDPYNFGDVSIENIINFANNYYCEVIFNYFSSDYNRNSKNITASNKQEKIFDSMKGLKLYKKDMSEKDVLEIIKKGLKGTFINHVFCYTFRIGKGKGTELYKLLYGTPSASGLELIKDSLWKVFSGDKYYKKPQVSEQQLSFLDNNEVRKINAEYYAIEAKKIILEEFSNKNINYNELEVFILENTMLKKSHIIKDLLKPLIDEGKIIKNTPLGKRKNNYTDSYYQVLSDE